MSVTSWSPNTEKLLSFECLVNAIQLIQQEGFPSEAPNSVLDLQAFARSDEAIWQTSIDQFDTEQLRCLVKFFTLAEARWPNWFGGDKNPAIWLCKALKQRGAFPDKSLTVWIKQHSENRFLPYGNVML